MWNDHSIAGTTILQTTLEDADSTQFYWWLDKSGGKGSSWTFWCSTPSSFGSHERKSSYFSFHGYRLTMVLNTETSWSPTTVIAEIFVRVKISYSSVREFSYAINFRTLKAVSHTPVYVQGFRMLLIFVLSAKSTKYTKLNRVLKFLRLQYYLFHRICLTINKIVYYQHLLVSFEELLSLRLSDHFALVVGCINNNWLNLWKKNACKLRCSQAFRLLSQHNFVLKIIKK